MKVYEIKFKSGSTYIDSNGYKWVVTGDGKELRRLVNINKSTHSAEMFSDFYETYDIVNMDFEPYIDWEKVPVDTKVLVRDSKKADWEKRHFSHYVKDAIFKYACYTGGRTSWTDEGISLPENMQWKYCKLAEEE